MGVLRKLLKALAWLTGGLVALLAVLYLTLLAINWHDRPPSEAALRFMAAYRDRPLVADTDNAFVYASGFFVKPGEDPQAAGVRRIAWMSNALKDPSRATFSTAEAYDYKALRSAAVQGVSDACRDGTSECLAALEGSAAALAEWSVSERWLFDRYLTLISRPGWRENAPPDLRMTLLAYGTIIEGQRLLFVEAWARAGEKDAAAVRNLLSQDARFWRHTLACSDILITKMVATNALKRHFKLGDLVLRRLPPEQEAAARPSEWEEPMTMAERSMKRTWVGEWLFLTSVVERSKTNDSPEWADQGPLGPTWQRAGAPFLQVQDFSNQWAEAFERANAELDVPYERYQASAARAGYILSGSTSDGELPPLRLYNLYGNLLRWVGGMNYVPYSRRTVDIEGVRRVALLASELRSRGIPATQVAAEVARSTIRDPYTGNAFGWDERKSALVFTGLEPGLRGVHEVIY